MNLIREINKNVFPNIHSLLIIKNQKLVLEEYFNGYTDTMLHDLRSAGKSIESSLIGIAIDKGYIKDEHINVLNLFKTYDTIKNLNEYKEQITLHHLLTMTSGLDCGNIYDYENHSGYLMHQSSDPIKYYLDLKSIHKPGTFFNYNDSEPYMVTVIRYLKTYISQHYFLKEFLFKPLSISSNSGGKLTPRDMAKFGLLYLNKGKWNNKQIISEEWINKSTKNQVYWGNNQTTEATNKFADGYGYYWWIKTFNVNKRKIPSYFAAGNGGQYIIIFPTLDMVTVFTGGNYNNPKARQVLDIINKYILTNRFVMSL